MANPVLNDKVFQRAERMAQTAAGETMSVEGSINKSAFLLLLVVGAAAWVWTRYFQTLDPTTVMPYLWGGLIVGLVAALVTIFLPTWARISAPVYALAQGLAVGAISAFYEQQLKGIVVQAIGLTFGVLAVMLFAYRTGLIKVTDRFRLIVVAATGGIALLYLVSIVLSFFNISIPFIHQGGTFGIIFSLVVVGIAAMNLALDFDFITRGVEHGAPKFLEWYAAFGLMVTLIWLYLEILRLLAKLRRR
ncbi:MAG: Bax inhibitor-1/YccA family protein [Gemmatimonadales bacterium]